MDKRWLFQLAYVLSFSIERLNEINMPLLIFLILLSLVLQAYGMLLIRKLVFKKKIKYPISKLIKVVNQK